MLSVGQTHLSLSCTFFRLFGVSSCLRGASTQGIRTTSLDVSELEDWFGSLVKFYQTFAVDLQHSSNAVNYFGMPFYLQLQFCSCPRTYSKLAVAIFVTCKTITRLGRGHLSINIDNVYLDFKNAVCLKM